MLPKILVIGDVMLDRYWFGDVTRLSQEAPVPVVKMSREEHRAGAAANVAMNCAALGESVTLIGIVGQDESADIFFELLVKHGINAFILSDRSIKTTQKLRVIGRHQQIVRVDVEKKPCLTITEKALEQIALHDVIVFSDYGKGALTDISVMIRAAKELGKTVLVDPKGYDYARYTGADMVKPNLDEIREMTGGWGSEEQLGVKANRIREDANIGAILLTRGADGMTLYNGEMKHIHSTAKEVFDVTGAGDTVMAALAVMLTRGMDLLAAAWTANFAAGVVCGKFGTATCNDDELREAINGITHGN